MNLMTVLTISFWCMYEVFKRYTNKVVFRKVNESLWRVLEYPIIVSIIIFFIAFPTFIIAAFRVLFKGREYRTA